MGRAGETSPAFFWQKKLPFCEQKEAKKRPPFACIGLRACELPHLCP
jgi:hypothetical protein